MHPFAVLSDPVRRRLVELLANGERPAGELVELIGGEFGITQSAVSQQLQVLKDQGFATVRPEGRRRIYAIDPEPLRAIGTWIAHYRPFWEGDLADGVEGGKTERSSDGRPPS